MTYIDPLDPVWHENWLKLTAESIARCQAYALTAPKPPDDPGYCWHCRQTYKEPVDSNGFCYWCNDRRERFRCERDNSDNGDYDND